MKLGTALLAMSIVFGVVAPASAAEPKPAAAAAAQPGVRTVYLIRHGQYDQKDPRDETVGRGLVPLGIAQARLVAARLLGLKVEWSSFRSSTMTRARQTALVIGQDFPELQLVSTPMLNECTVPTRRKDIEALEKPEEIVACRDRLAKDFDEIFVPSPKGDQNDLIVAHGNVIRYFVTRALDVDPEAWLGLAIGNCSLTVIEVLPDGSKKLLSFSDVGHIPPNLQTWTSPGPKATLSITATETGR